MKDNFTLAKETAIKAGELILKYFNADYEIQNKSYNNPVTTADKEADKLIKKKSFSSKSKLWLAIRRNKRFSRSSRKKFCLGS